MEGPRLLVKMKPDNLIRTNLSQEKVEWAGIDGTRLAMASGKWGSLIYMLEIFHNKKCLNNLNQAPLPCRKPGCRGGQALAHVKAGVCPTVTGHQATFSCLLGPGRPSLRRRRGNSSEALQTRRFTDQTCRVSANHQHPFNLESSAFHWFPVEMPPDTPESPNSGLFLGKFHRVWL